MRWTKQFCFGFGLLAFDGSVTPLFPQSDHVHQALDALIAAYPSALSSHDGKAIAWRDGTVMPVSEGAPEKTFAELLRSPSIIDQFQIPYPRGPLENPPALNADPGRFRNTSFFTKMYGNCKEAGVSRRLAPVVWLPNTWGKTIQITSVNQVDDHLRAVSAELDLLPPGVKSAAYPIAGTYNCRAIADTGQLSPHGFGIAIDLNLAVSDYWYWLRRDHNVVYRNRMPQEIVAIFEKHGFIWGGKWYHFDTMHFEYRPELLGVRG
jgi:hypothetical protein